MFLARNDRRGVYKGSFGPGGIALGNLAEDVESFRLIRTGELYYISERQPSKREFSTHVYARRDGIGTLTAISVSAPVIIASMKQFTDATTNNYRKANLGPVKNNFVMY
jgi:hypothetical protein